jgi:anthranilate/para-aminobenzoate synthase component I
MTVWLRSGPIAGTMSREDERGSPLDKIPKEAAEHLMLVDLARNDLARCAVPGGVQVTSFMQQDTYGSLLHLVSTVETKVREHCDVWDLIVANFPAGTMTGAPKVRAMEIIAELEGSARGLYTGCVGYITGANSAVLALTIRTIVGNAGRYVLQSAAGVVADSEPEDEWNEAGAKIKSFFPSNGSQRMRVMLVDAFDSFVYVIEQYYSAVGAETRVVRVNDDPIAHYRQWQPQLLVLGAWTGHSRRSWLPADHPRDG